MLLEHILTREPPNCTAFRL